MELRKNDIRLRRLDKYNYVIEVIKQYRPGARMAGQEYPSQVFYYARLEDALVCFVDQLTVKYFDESQDYTQFLDKYKGIRGEVMGEIKEFVGALQKTLDLPEDK